MKHWLETDSGRLYLLQEYVAAGKSAAEIAVAKRTHYKRVLRALKGHGIPTRDRSAAQLKALERNRARHPTRGRARTADERAAIGAGLRAAYRTGKRTVNRERPDPRPDPA